MSLPPPDFSSLDLVTEGQPGSWAVFSPDRTYRYMLARTWDAYGENNELFDSPVRPLMVFIMLNPSTADAFKEDPTIRRCVSFAKRERCGGIIVVNLFAYRSTDPDALTKVADPIGPHNLRMIQWALESPMLALAVAAWGSFKSVRVRKLAITPILTAKTARYLWCLGKTANDDPRHPLMLAKDTKLVSLNGVLR